MVTPEERITRIEAIQEANAQQLAEVLSRLNHVLQVVEAGRQEVREMNEAARREAREMNGETRRESREEIRTLPQETQQSVEAARRDARNLLFASVAIVSTWGAGLIGLWIAILQRLPN